MLPTSLPDASILHRSSRDRAPLAGLVPYRRRRPWRPGPLSPDGEPWSLMTRQSAPWPALVPYHQTEAPGHLRPDRAP